MGSKTEILERRWKISDYHPSDENAICTLFEKVFGKPMGATESIRHWRWEFSENPLNEIFIKLAWDGKKLVGQYAANPIRIYAEGRDIIAALSHDTMTDPQYSGLGIFRNTAKALYNDQKKAGHYFIYGFPNGNSIHGFRKNLNWQQIMTVPVHIRPVQVTIHLLKGLFTKKRLFSKNQEENIFFDSSTLLSDKSGVYELRVESEFGDWADELWQRCRGQHRLWIVRDKTYLNWRYVTRPESKYEIVSAWQGRKPVGYVITTCTDKNFGKILFIMDFMVDLNFRDVPGILIRCVINRAKERGVACASVLLPPGSRYRQLFRRHLFLPLPESFFPHPLYFGARCFDLTLRDLVYEPKAWSISWGDDDVL